MGKIMIFFGEIKFDFNAMRKFNSKIRLMHA